MSKQRKRSAKKPANQPKGLPRLDLSRFKANPDAYFTSADLEEAGVRSQASQERDRWLKTGVPFTKVGRRIFYLGKDVLDAVAKNSFISEDDEDDTQTQAA